MKKRETMLTIAGFVILMSNFIYLIYRYLTAIRKVQEYIFTFNPLYMAAGVALPVIWWIYSTKEDEWNYYNHKNTTLRIVVINAIMILMQWVWTLSFDVFVYRICRLPSGRNLTEDMIINLCRAALIIPTAGIGYGLYGMIETIFTTNDMDEKINNFRWQHIVDTRKGIEQKYDLRIIRDMKTGRVIPIKEEDRLLHKVLLGSSGTGKTSMSILPEIINDLNKKVENALKRQEGIKNLIKKGSAYILNKPGKTEYSEYDVQAVKGYEKELDKVRTKYPDCGITFIAPNAAGIDKVKKLCEARSLPLNIIDPMRDDYSGPGVRMLGINPFYVTPGLPPQKAQIEIVHNAQVFSATLMAINELQKTTETYFRDLNTSITSNIAIVCMLRAYLTDTQTWMPEIDGCIREFEKLRPMVEEIQEILHMKIIVHEIPNSKKENIRVDTDNLKETDSDSLKEVIYYDIEDSEVPDKFRNEGMTAIEYREYTKNIGESYRRIIYDILKDLLGTGEEKMQDQARGLRVIMGNFLLDPRINKLFSSKETNNVNWNRALLRNEITVINTALEIGTEASTGLGLFLMLNLRNAIESRPEKTRTPHFIIIDEATQYMHPVIEDMFAIFRQYGGACTFAFQSFSQLDKTPMTKFLSGVIKGAGTHIVYGRITPEEMKIYEAMVGQKNMEVIQKTISSNSELDPNFNVTHSQRAMTETNPKITGDKMRMKNFSEITVFPLDRGRVLGGIAAKVNFPKKSEYKDRKIRYVDFSKYATLEKEKIPARIQAEIKEEKAGISEFKTGITHTIDSKVPEPLNEIKGRPIATDYGVRDSMGKMNILLDQLQDEGNAWTEFMKKTMEAEEKGNAGIKTENTVTGNTNGSKEPPEENNTQYMDDDETERLLEQLNSQRGRISIG